MKSATDRKFTESIIRGIIESFIVEGTIDPKEKTAEELRDEFWAERNNYLKHPNREILIGTDHRSRILGHARRFVKSEEREIACMLYATWFEHWFNHIIVSIARKKHLNDEDSVQIIRDTPFRGKSTWLLTLMNLKPINTKHLQAIMKITEMRNQFVHYKWKTKDDEASHRDTAGLKDSITTVEKPVKYLQQYEQKYIFHKTKQTVRRAAKVR